MLLSALLIQSGGCAKDIVAIADVTPFCRELAPRPVCISQDDVLTPRTASSILRVNDGIRAACPKEAKPCPKEVPPPKPGPVKPAASGEAKTS